MRLGGAKFTAYRTALFQRVRLLDSIDYPQIKKSLDPLVNRQQIFSSGEASGASGSFFFFSHDNRFIVKTMTKEELELACKHLPRLYRHYVSNPDSLIARIYGVFSIRQKGFKKVHLIVMKNTL